MFKKIYWFLIITLFVINASIALAVVTYSINSPANLVAGGDAGQISITINTGGDVVAGSGFTLTPSDVAKLTLINPQQGNFVVGPNFNCNIVVGTLVCSTSGLNGDSGFGSLVTVQATVPANTAAGDITLTLSGLSADDDLGDPLVLAPVIPSTITINPAPVCVAVPANCAALGVTCVGNVAGVENQVVCAGDNVCNDQNVCAAPVCVAVPANCAALGVTCVDNVAGVENQVVCAGDNVCNDQNDCAAIPPNPVVDPPPGCENNAECEVGEICDVTNTCVAGGAECQNDNECQEGETCEAGKCLTPFMKELSEGVNGLPEAEQNTINEGFEDIEDGSWTVQLISALANLFKSIFTS